MLVAVARAGAWHTWALPGDVAAAGCGSRLRRRAGAGGSAIGSAAARRRRCWCQARTPARCLGGGARASSTARSSAGAPPATCGADQPALTWWSATVDADDISPSSTVALASASALVCRSAARMHAASSSAPDAEGRYRINEGLLPRQHPAAGAGCAGGDQRRGADGSGSFSAHNRGCRHELSSAARCGWRARGGSTPTRRCPEARRCRRRAAGRSVWLTRRASLSCWLPSFVADTAAHG